MLTLLRHFSRCAHRAVRSKAAHDAAAKFFYSSTAASASPRGPGLGSVGSVGSVSSVDSVDTERRRILLVTGGGRGIGAAVARLAFSRGYDVCVNYRSD
eukprot:CAMPEP_0167793418 /NCGR_PEP_ID=MMETSP0111_2-20121227/13166_1 /TAXON_ID=91324 /ORGANISM="Lotharella globosa, Strain CCCM811" /LENGTH=98 /DNA_ID=CAMNT_0007686567 /DNA_START=139 /DNA_END=432 /DNA_ORIENTATION=+